MEVNALQINHFPQSKIKRKSTAFFRVQFSLASHLLQQPFGDAFISIAFCNILWWRFWHNSCITGSHLMAQTLRPCVISLSRHVA